MKLVCISFYIQYPFIGVEKFNKNYSNNSSFKLTDVPILLDFMSNRGGNLVKCKCSRIGG